MPEPRNPRRYGPLPWQAKLSSALFDRAWDARMAEIREAEAQLAATRAASAAWRAERRAEQEAAHTESPSLTPRAIAITSPLSHDLVVIEVGDAQLTLSREEAARLFAMGRDFGAPQPGAQEAGHA